MKTLSMKTLLTGLFFLFATCEMAFAVYSWPLNPANQAHTITSTLDERRSRGRRFHRGVDIDGDVGETVYARFGATVEDIGAHGVMLDNDGRGFYYYHIVPNGDLEEEEDVATGDVLGTIDENSHLHFEEGPFNSQEDDVGLMNFPEYNPLRITGLSPQYNPPNSPQIQYIRFM